MLDRIVEKLYGEPASDVLAVKLAGLFSARRARLLARTDHTLREAEELLGLPSPEVSLRCVPPPRRSVQPPEKFAEWSTPLSAVPGSGPLLGGLAAGIGDRDAVSGLGTGFGSLLGQSAGGALGGMVGPHAGRALAKYLGEDKDTGAMWGRALGTLGGSALGGALGGYVGRQQTRPPATMEGPQAGERRAEYKLAGLPPGLAARLTGAGVGAGLGGLAGYNAQDPKLLDPVFNPHMRRNNALMGALLGGGLGAATGHVLSSPGGARAVGGAMEHMPSSMRDVFGDAAADYMKHTSGPNPGPRLSPDLEAALFQRRTGGEKVALSPLQTLLSRAAAPAAIGALGAYAASPQDPESELRNSLTGAGIGGGLGLLHALHRSFSANPQLASELMRNL
jgi:hypothetical protein